MDYQTALAQLLSLQAEWGSLSQSEKSARYESTRAAKRERQRAGLRRCGHAHDFAPAPEVEGDER